MQRETKKTNMTMDFEAAGMTSKRRYFLPQPALREVISHYTIYDPAKVREERAASEYLNLVPDASGCMIGFVYPDHLDMQFLGPSSRAIVVKGAPEDVLQIVFVEFRPGGANRLLGQSMLEFQNMKLPLEEVDKALATRFYDNYERYCRNGADQTFLALLKNLDEFLLKRLLQTERLPLLDQVLSEVFRTGGTLRVSELAQTTAYSERHLNRVVSDRLGLNLKRFLRVVRINRACLWMQSYPFSLTELAQELQYHDQAHFIHDFKTVCGLSPGQYRQALSDFYNEALKLGGIMPKK